MMRGMQYNLAQLVTYDIVKDKLDKMMPEEPVMTCLSSALLAAIVVSLTSLPFNNVRDKMWEMRVQSDGKFPYNSISDCFKKIYAKGGLKSFWSGLPHYYPRVGS